MLRRVSSRALVGGLVGAVCGGLLGGWLGRHHGAAFVVPDPIDPSRWSVLVPGMDENVVSHSGRGVQVVGGAIVLTPHVFHRADVLLPRDQRGISGVTIELLPGSGPVSLRLRSRTTMVDVNILPDAWRVLPGGWTPHEGPVELRIGGGEARIGGVALGPVGPANLELTASREVVRLRGITLLDEAGVPFLVEDAEAAWVGRAPIGWGAVAGALACGGLAATGGLGGLLVLVPPVAVALVPAEAWLELVERLYLVRMSPWELARLALALAIVPLLVRLLARSGLAIPSERSNRTSPRWLWAWAALSVVAAGFGGREQGGSGWMFAPIGVGFFLAPLLFARAAGLDRVGVLLRDLPSALVIAVAGWGVGLLGAIAWRLALLVAGAGTLLRRAPRVAADGVFISALALLPAAEFAARSTWLDTAWDAARLEDDQSWRNPNPFWQDTCGAAPRKAVLFTGGSSTGGAYQFEGEPTAFYPSRIHTLLCAAGLGIRTANYGYGGRDSFTVSRSLPTLLAAQEPAVVVTYLGVNDLLTQESSLTRAEREAVEEGRSAATRGLASLGARSRLLTGLALLTRPALDPDAAVVSDVPLPDAEVNLRRMAAATLAAGTWLVLVPEYTETETLRRLAEYATLEQRLAAELPGVVYVDVVAALAPYTGEGLLIDRNHLSRKGSGRLAEVLAPVLAKLLEAAPPATTLSSTDP
ncbi:MAG: SGNH/GDSL hydrolase family protein [Pseudomonadota bacterium]|nr:SGNH/GDSL hydrolase family protein [Pseudomonadota bacterium]